MPTLADAQELVRSIHALAGGPEVRRKAAARALARVHATEATELLQHLIDLTRSGWEPARCVMGSVVAALAQDAEEIPHADALRRVAGIQDLPLVEDLFADGPAAREMPEDAAARNDAKLFTESLGHLKSKARLTRDPDEMARLAAAANAAVVRQLLLNPRLTESVVVRIAARRPARPEPLIEIWRSPRWFARHAVKRALAFNPYLPPEVGSKIVPLLTTTDWRELAEDRGVHESIRDQARQLLCPPTSSGDLN
jgi:hypothetical protein